MNGKFVSSMMLTLLLSVGAVAEGKRYLVVLKDQESYRAAKILTSKVAGPDQVLSIRSQESFRAFARLTKKVESHLDRIQSIVVQNASAEEIAQLKANPGVALVEEEVFHALPPKPNLMLAASQGTTLSSEDGDAGSSRVPVDSFVPGEGTPWGIRSVRAVESWRDSRGGKGARVMVLDTGIDKKHPALAGNFEEGRNFSCEEKADAPKESCSVPADLYDDNHGHGTHVAGTIAGIAMGGGFTGVAPEARILAGRVCTGKGCSNIAIAQGVDWGVEKKVDVISMSLGGMWATPAERMAIQRALQAGVTVVAASGNSGAGQVSFPAALPGVIAVGAVDEKLEKASFSQYGPELAIVAPGVDVASSVPRGSGRATGFQLVINQGAPEALKSTLFQGSADVPVPMQNRMVAAGLGSPADFAKVNVKGLFAFVVRGEITFGDKVKNAMAAGAAGVIIANNVPGALNGTLNQDGQAVAVPVFGLDQADGEKILKALNASHVVRASMEVRRTDYAAMDGTSMATPHISGVVALMKSVNKKLTPAQVKKILQQTAKPLGPNGANQFGAGLALADAAVAMAKVTEAEALPAPEAVERPQLPLHLFP